MRLRGALFALATLSGFGLVFLGGAKLNGVEPALEALAGVGVSGRWIAVVGWSEIVIGIMLAHRPLRRLGGALLAGWMSGALAFHLRVGDLAGASVPMSLLGLALAVSVVARNDDLLPGDWVPIPLARAPEGAGPRVRFLANRIGLAFMFRWAVGGGLFWASLPVLGAVQAGRGSLRRPLDLLHGVLLYLLFFGFGVGGLWNFTGHFFMSDIVAASTGWQPGSPFQHELAFYHLGSGVVGILCFWWRDRFWTAAALVPCLFVYGAVLIHIREFVIEGNTAPANWGFNAVGVNLIIPTAVLGLLALYARRGGFKTRWSTAAPRPVTDESTTPN